MLNPYLHNSDIVGSEESSVIDRSLVLYPRHDGLSVCRGAPTFTHHLYRVTRLYVVRHRRGEDRWCAAICGKWLARR